MLDPDSTRAVGRDEPLFGEEGGTPAATAPKNGRVAGRVAGLLGAIRRLRNFVAFKSFSSLTRRIVLLNLAGMCALVSGILY
ncbi:MAG TPA: sensor N-terminal transmembrane domain-containing protein, partial [Ancylobacter sp.]